MTSDPILDDLFHAVAWAAFLQQSRREQGWPDPEATRRLAYRMYEEALADKNARTTSTSDYTKVKV